MDFGLEEGMLRLRKEPMVEDEDLFCVIRNNHIDETQLESIIRQYQACAARHTISAFVLDFLYKDEHGEGVAIEFEKVKAGKDVLHSYEVDSISIIRA